jgi:pyrroline-5-carboxylate reductase
MKIAIIGGGNMATALIGSLLSSDHNINQIRVAEPGIEARERLTLRWPINCFATATEAIQGMDAIVLAVKPSVVSVVLDEIGDLLNSQQMIISIAAGIHSNQISAQISSESPVVRTMPNTPALIGLGITGMYASDNCSQFQRGFAQQIMESAGEIVWIEDESLMDVVTAISGSGPAYFYYMIEALRNAGTRLGLPADVASKLALFTARGAGALAVLSDADVSELRDRVTTKGGTTEAALKQFIAADFEQIVDSAVEAATRRSQALATEGSQV